MVTFNIIRKEREEGRKDGRKERRKKEEKDRKKKEMAIHHCHCPTRAGTCPAMDYTPRAETMGGSES